ncbi:MAG: sigma 54-interacting transcriptional regulator [Thermodesulfobacteriota bacterium]
MEFESYRDFLLSIVRERTLGGVFGACERYFHRREHAARAAVWLVEETSPDQVLILFWSLSRRAVAPGDRFTDLYKRVPFSEPLFGRTAATLEQQVADGTDQWDVPAWARAEGITSYLTSPLIHKDRIIGVVAVFFSQRMGEAMAEGMKWQRMLADYLAAAIVNARAFEEIADLRRQLELENEYLREEVRAHSFGDIIGDGETMQRLMNQVELVAPTDAGVLILGETGTGKELIARAIHQRSRRAHRPLIKVNCAAIPADLFESEFFGHVRGAFTGAVRDRVGRFELADEGTIFLDEVSEIPLELQGKLLRVLQEGAFERIGEETTRRVSVRVLAATNRDVKEAVQKGAFRKDLYFRLSVFPLQVPALRERIEDIPALALWSIREAAQRVGLAPPKLKKRHVAELQRYSWPGNIRELINVMERAVILSRGGDLSFGFMFPDETPGQGSPDRSGSGLETVMTESELIALQQANITRALELSGGRIQGPGGAAERLGLPPTTLRSRLKALGVKRLPAVHRSVS